MNKPQTTIAYNCYSLYRNSFFVNNNIESKLKEYRDFFHDRQYERISSKVPQPTLNVCREFCEKSVAKLLEAPYHIVFTADEDSKDLNKLESFYEYQMKQIDDDTIDYQIVMNGFVDGIGIAFTTFDKDTYGSNTKFRGFLKRAVIPFEQTFFENPYITNIQDQKYLGYVYQMSVGAVKKILEKPTKEKLELIVPEDYFDFENYNTQNIDSKQVNVYCRLFRVDGEVVFELSTKYCDLFEHPHFLNPTKNENTLNNLEQSSDDKSIKDYKNTDEAKYVLFEKAVRGNNEKEKNKFNRYPVSVFRPRPRNNSILGESPLKGIIPTQKTINYNLQQIMLIEQSHSMPKILAKPEALKNQVYDTSPNQIIYDHTPVTRGVQWGITRLSSGDAINSNIIGLATTFIELTRQINGFENIVANANNDISGYAFQQMNAQANLMLEQPQKRFWEYKRENARSDLLYFKHYIEEASYYEVRSESEIELQENYRAMSQDFINKGMDESIPQGEVLPSVKKVIRHDIEKEFFDKDFEVSVEVESGVAGSAISESQHYQQVFQYIAAGNLRPDMIRVMVENDPAFSKRLKQRVINSIKSSEVTALARKEDELNQAKQLINTLTQKLKESNLNTENIKERYKALEKASIDNAKMNAEFVKLARNNGDLKTESEVKSDNAKGISGGTFS